jgi:hypothetical protein
MFPGVVPLALAVYGVVRLRRELASSCRVVVSSLFVFISAPPESASNSRAKPHRGSHKFERSNI